MYYLLVFWVFFTLFSLFYLRPLKNKVYEIDREVGSLNSDVKSIKEDVHLIKESVIGRKEFCSLLPFFYGWCSFYLVASDVKFGFKFFEKGIKPVVVADEIEEEVEMVFSYLCSNVR